MAMPLVNVRFDHELRCETCQELLATAGTYASVVSEDGVPILVNEADPPQLAVRLECSKAHRTIPVHFTAEYSFMTPKKAKKAAGRVIARI